jgi:thioredoxin-like negative regulator of GroEL
MTEVPEAPKPYNASEEAWMVATHYSNAKPHESVFVVWTAPWCAPCKAMKPVLEHVAGQLNKVLFIVNVDEIKSMAVAFGIRSVPTVIELKDGFPTTRRLIGGQSEAAIREFLNA